MSRPGTLTDDAVAEAWTVVERSPREETDGSAPLTLLDRWRGYQLRDDAAFDTYLTQIGLNARQLAQVLSGASWAPRPGADLWWSESGSRMWQPSDTEASARHTPDDADRLLAGRPVVIENTLFDSLPFPGLLVDAVRRHDRFLDERLGDLAGDLSDDVRADLRAALAGRLGQVAVRCLLAEMHRRRQDGELTGASSKEQYESFDASLRSFATRGAFLRRYPSLARDLTTVGRQWEASSETLVRRLAADRDALADAGLLPSAESPIAGVELGSGDPHDHGESVAVLTFADGGRLVYKPRDTRLYELYRRMVEELRPELPPGVILRAPQVLPRSRYGWVEFIDACDEPLTDPRPHDYLRALGAAAGLAHLLGASDLHLENVIATADGPVPVDLETVVQNRSDARCSSATERAVHLLNASVLGSGYLPVRIGGEDQGAIDVSVLTGGLGSPRSGEALRIVDSFTSRMRIEYRTQQVGRSRNQPPGMTMQIVRDNAEAVATGFTDLCQAALRRKGALVRLVEQTENLTFRHLVRPTRSYSLLLQEATQPYCSGSGLARDNLFNRLWHRLHDHPDDGDVVMAELTALHRRDVPLFQGDLDGRRLWADGHPVGDPFARTGREELRLRLHDLTPQRIRSQRELVLEAIAAATAGPDEEGATTPATPSVQIPPITARRAHDRVRTVAAALADRLHGDAVSGEDDVTWVGVSSGTGNTGLEYRPLGNTLYDGLAGVSVALGYAGLVLDDPRLVDLAGRALEPVRSHLADWLADVAPLPVGGFSGVAGTLFALGHHAHITGEPIPSTTYRDTLRRLTKAVAEDTYLDVTTGAAGLCAVLAAGPTGRNDPDLAACVRAAANRLTATATSFPDGSLGWAVGDERVYLGGFSHGTTGIGWALARAGRFLDDPSLAEAARQALAFDDRLFDPVAHRWTDARPEARSRQGQHHPVHWCHGAAGIALGRLDAGIALDDGDLVRAGLDAAAIVHDAGLPPNDSLCHGSLGNWEALRLAAAAGPATAVTAEASWRDAVVDRVVGRGFVPGLPDGVRTVPGLMLGISGALLTFCRFLDPDAVPPALLLAPPPS